jgi:glycosyltransferase involved in cell wall biosynthesis
MKIGILGTRGIPNNYGGFEQFAEKLSVGLVQRNHQVWVYAPHNHPYKEETFEGVQLIRCFDPEYRVGTAGQFIYDYNCIKDARKRSFDVLLQLGYTSSSVWSRWLPKQSRIITNMDGLEWKRSKYKQAVKRFLKKAEKWAVSSSDYLVADSKGIQDYLFKTYNATSTFIAYGAEWIGIPSAGSLEEMQLSKASYDMLVARLEPENSIEIILEGVLMANSERLFLVIGNDKTAYGSYLKAKFESFPKIHFLGGIYDQQKLNALRYYSNLYFHGHQVGGTNPSLLEAMACSALIVAHKNEFNASVLGNDGFYFSSSKEVAMHLEKHIKSDNLNRVSNNLEKVKKSYSWEKIIQGYEELFLKAIN